MASRESSLGAWADKIPRVDGWTGSTTWDDKCAYEVPVTPDAVAHELKRVGVLFLMGLAALLVAGGLLATNLELILHGERTTGSIVDLRRMPRGYAPVAAFIAGGQRYRVQGKTSTKMALYEIGDPIPVLFNPSDPDEAAVGGFVQLYLVPTIIGGFGLALVLLATGCGVYVLRKAGRELGAGG